MFIFVLSAESVVSVEAPVGRAEDETTTAPVFTAVTFVLSAESVASVEKPVIAAGGVRVVICAAGRTTGIDAAESAWPCAGILVSILPTDVFPVV